MKLAAPSWSELPWRVAAAALILVKLWLVSAQPIFALPGATIDDGLFARLARHLLAGEWLGPYDVLTLAKGPAYSFFIAATVKIGVPLPLAQHLLYISAALVLVRALQPVLRRPAWSFVLFAVLLWNPMTYEMGVMGRVLRQHLYTPAALLLLAGLIALGTRTHATRPVRIGWAVLVGLAGSCMWLTREETIWIAPACALLVGTALVLGRRLGHSWASACWPFACAAVVAVIPVTIVAGINARHYGWRGTVEFRAQEFVSAYGALARVRPPDGPVPLVPVTRATRELLYAHSPRFAELRGSLEGDVGRWGAHASSPFTQLDVDRMEIAGGWWMWALRDSVARAGHASSARSNLDYYAALAAEINAACDGGQLPALPRRDSMTPVWHPFYTAKAKREAWPFLRYFITFDGFGAHTPKSHGDVALLAPFNALTRWPHSPVEGQPELAASLTVSQQRRIRILDSIGHGWRNISHIVVVIGLIGWLGVAALAAFRRQAPGAPWWFATALWSAAASSVAITFLVHVTSFPAMNPGYFSHAYPCLIAAVVVSCAAVFSRRAIPPSSRTTSS